MKNNWWIYVTVSLAAAFAVACGQEQADDTPDEIDAAEAEHGDMHWERITTTGVDAFDEGVASFAPEDSQFHQVGLLMDGELSGALQYRVRHLDGAWGSWADVDVTWSEDTYHVGRIFLDEKGEELELRSGDGLEQLTLEFYDEVQGNPEVLTRELPLESSVDTGDDDGEIGTVHQAVAPSSMVISRHGWNARHPNKVCGYSHSPYRMTIHHTESPSTDGGNPAARMRQMQAFHIDNRDWCDIGYHFVVSQSGSIFQGRSSSQRTGAHAIGQNTGNVGISLIGNFDSQTPSQTQMTAAADIMRWTHQRYSIPLNRSRVQGHREWPGQWTACPGTNLLSRISDLLQMAGQSPSSPPSGSSDSGWLLRNTTAGGSADISYNYGRSGDTPIAGDWNGDGQMTQGVVRGSTWHLKNSHGGGSADTSFNYGQSGDTPVVGDWNGDGKMTPGVVRGNTWHLKNSLGGGSADHTFKYGQSGDTPVVGDWNGDGKMTPGVVRGSTWHLKNSLGGGSADRSFNYGQSGDEPVAGDWNANGQWTPGVVRGSTWHLKNSLGGGSADHSFNYGRSDDKPLVGDWNTSGTMTPAVIRFD